MYVPLIALYIFKIHTNHMYDYTVPNMANTEIKQLKMSGEVGYKAMFSAVIICIMDFLF